MRHTPHLPGAFRQQTLCCMVISPMQKTQGRRQGAWGTGRVDVMLNRWSPRAGGNAQQRPKEVRAGLVSVQERSRTPPVSAKALGHGGGRRAEAAARCDWSAGGGLRMVPGKASPFSPRAPGARNRKEGKPQGHWLRCGGPNEAAGGRPGSGATARG